MNPKELTDAQKLQAVINTLEMMNIPATYDNVNKLTGIYQTLFAVMNSIEAKEALERSAESEREADTEERN